MTTHLQGMTADSPSTGWVDITSWLPAGLSVPTSGWARALRTGSLVTIELQVDVDDTTLTSLLTIPIGWRKTNAPLSRILAITAAASMKGSVLPSPSHSLQVYLGASGAVLRCNSLTGVGTAGVTATWHATDPVP